MRFLVIAPSAVQSRSATIGASRMTRRTLTSQLDHTTFFLTHEHAGIAIPDEVIAAAPHLLRVHEAHVSVLLGYAVFLADIEVTIDAALTAQEIEARLTEVTLALTRATQREDLSEPRWVARYVVDGDDPAFVDAWAAADAERLPLDAQGRAAITVGWGNGVITGWDDVAIEQRRAVMAGLVDAQALWCQLEDIHQESLSELRELYLDDVGTALARKVVSLTELNARLQVHNLCVSELVTGTQGLRRDIARATLRVWGFEQLGARTSADIDAAVEHTEAIQRLRSQRYQRAVEVVLLALTLISAFGLSLNFIQVAFLNVTSHRPDDAGFDLPLVGVFRDIDADAIILVTAIAILLILALLLLARRPGRLGRRR